MQRFAMDSNEYDGTTQEVANVRNTGVDIPVLFVGWQDVGVFNMSNDVCSEIKNQDHRRLRVME